MDGKLAKFIWENYPTLQAFDKENIKNLFNTYKDNVVTVGDIEGVGFYLKLTDKTYKKVRDRELDITDANVFMACLKENGKNIHFAFTVAKDFKTLREGLRRVIKKERPTTISWFSPMMDYFFTRRF